MLELIGTALVDMLDFSTIIGMIAGLAVGLSFGAMPGLNATIGITLLLPVTFGMNPAAALLMLIGVYCGATFAGSISAILIKTPGTAAASATVLEGYPMTLKGKASTALSIALRGSVIGGLFSGKSILKGVVMAVLGLLVNTIGIDPQQGVYRLTFGSDILVRGVDLVPALIGLFAVSELFSQAEKKILRLSQPPQVKMQKAHGWMDMLKFKWLMLKSSIIGVIVGACPGTGAAIAAFLSYGEAKRSSKHPEEFGNGSEEGLCAAETANNAVTGATLIPMLTLGIPGDSVTAVLMGALTIQGLTPGTELFTKHADMTYIVLVGFIIVQILMYFMGRLAIRGFSQITRIPYYILLPMVMAFCMVGAYSCSNNMTDILIAIIFGLIGYIMPKFGFPTTPMLIGIVLGDLAEKNLVRTMAVYSGDLSVFFTRPIALLFFVLSIVSVGFALYQKKRDKQKAA